MSEQWMINMKQWGNCYISCHIHRIKLHGLGEELYSMCNSTCKWFLLGDISATVTRNN